MNGYFSQLIRQTGVTIACRMQDEGPVRKKNASTLGDEVNGSPGFEEQVFMNRESGDDIHAKGETAVLSPGAPERRYPGAYEGSDIIGDAIHDQSLAVAKKEGAEHRPSRPEKHGIQAAGTKELRFQETQKVVKKQPDEENSRQDDPAADVANGEFAVVGNSRQEAPWQNNDLTLRKNISIVTPESKEQSKRQNLVAGTLQEVRRWVAHPPTDTANRQANTEQQTEGKTALSPRPVEHPVELARAIVDCDQGQLIAGREVTHHQEVLLSIGTISLVVEGPSESSQRTALPRSEGRGKQQLTSINGSRLRRHYIR